MTQHDKKSLGPLPLLFVEPFLLIGTYADDGTPNVMPASWGGVCNGEPPCIGLAIRPSRWTASAIEKNKCFTVNIPSVKQVEAADYAGITTGKQVDKFASAGFTAIRAEYVNAPFIAECPMILECEVAQSFVLGSHNLVVGKVMDVKVVVDCLSPDGRTPDINAVNPLIYDGGMNRYFGLGEYVAEAFSVGKKLK